MGPDQATSIRREIVGQLKVRNKILTSKSNSKKVLKISMDPKPHSLMLTYQLRRKILKPMTFFIKSEIELRNLLTKQKSSKECSKRLRTNTTTMILLFQIVQLRVAKILTRIFHQSLNKASANTI